MGSTTWWPAWAVVFSVGLSACGDKEEPNEESTEIDVCDDPVQVFRDADGDGYGDPADGLETCSPPSTHVADDTDCDDSDAAVWPGAPEVCDGVDDDCDGLVDDEDPDISYADSDTVPVDVDEDGYAGDEEPGCPEDDDPWEVDDCDDDDDGVHPGATEDCSDELDQDCDELVDCEDPDCDGSCPEDCSDGRDNDGDGLQDCEDGDCATDGACVETADTCDDNVDNDGDGAKDCDDEDCWATGGCATLTAQVTGAAALTHTYQYYHSFAFTVASNDATYWWQNRVQATGITGTLLVDRGSRSTACSWTLASATAYRREGLSDRDNSTLGSLATSGACGLDTAFLQSLMPELAVTTAYVDVDSIVLRDTWEQDSLAVPWLLGATFATTTAVSQDSSFYHGSDGYGSPTSYSWYWLSRTRQRTAGGVAPGTWVGTETDWVGVPEE